MFSKSDSDRCGVTKVSVEPSSHPLREWQSASKKPQYICLSSFPRPLFTMMAPSKHSPELPLELLFEIIKFLPLTDLQTLSLVSRLSRSQAIPFIFGHLRYTGDLPLKIHNIHQARKDVKEVIKCAFLF